MFPQQSQLSLKQCNASRWLHNSNCGLMQLMWPVHTKLYRKFFEGTLLPLSYFIPHSHLVKLRTPQSTQQTESSYVMTACAQVGSIVHTGVR